MRCDITLVCSGPGHRYRLNKEKVDRYLEPIIYCPCCEEPVYPIQYDTFTGALIHANCGGTIGTKEDIQLAWFEKIIRYRTKIYEDVERVIKTDTKIIFQVDSNKHLVLEHFSGKKDYVVVYMENKSNVRYKVFSERELVLYLNVTFTGVPLGIEAQHEWSRFSRTNCYY